MKFEETGEASHPFKVTFEGDEIDVVKAVFREEMFNQALKGNVGSISDYDVTMADWDGAKETLPTRIINPHDFAQKFEDFDDATGDAIVDIAQEASVPPFLNDDIILRRKMGKQALDLANTIRSEAAKLSPLQSVDLDSLDLDAEFGSLLEEGRLDDEA